MNSSISRRAPGSPSPSPCRCCSRRPAPARRPGCPARCRGPRRARPAAARPASSMIHLAVAGEAHDVAGDLRDRRGDQGQIGAGEAQPRRPARERSCGPARCPRRAGSGSGPRCRSAGRRSSSGPLSRAHRLALEQVPGGVDLALPSPVAAGQGEQHRTTPISRRLDALQRQQVLHPQPGPRPVQLRRHRTGRGSPAPSPATSCPARPPHGPAALPLPLRQPAQRRRDGLALLLLEQPLIRSLDGVQLEDPVLVAALAVLRLPHRRDHVSAPSRSRTARACRARPGGPRPAPSPASPAPGPRQPPDPYPSEYNAPQHGHQSSDIGCRPIAVRPSSIELCASHSWHFTP